MDVTNTGGVNPLLTFSQPYRPAVGVFPATGGALPVGGTVSDSAHRFINIYTTVDFSRLVESDRDPGAAPAAPNYIAQTVADVGGGKCPAIYDPKGINLRGQLGLKETLATGMIAISMNDVGIFPAAGETKLASPAQATPAPPKPPAAAPPPPAAGPANPTNNLNSNGQYTFGMIAAQIDFTVVENINGGPIWTLARFKGPGGNSLGLVNLNRQVRDTLNITFVPVCVRHKYWHDPAAGPPYRYHPEMIVGTPGWANFLPSCDDSNFRDLQNRALSTGRYTNDINRITALTPVP